jgi:hypothetical protein
MSFDHEQVTALIRRLGSSDDLLAEAYIQGAVFIDDENAGAIESLKKTGILRQSEQADEYRLTTDVKRLIDRLLLRNARYRQNTDIARMIRNVEEDIAAYRAALDSNEQDEARYHLEQIDDTLYESLELLENSISVMFSAITSQFGFVSSLTSKIRENERALAYAQQLVEELNHINPEACYEWLNWAAPSELSRKIIRFVDQYKSIVERLASIVDRMKTLLFTLRQQEQTANRTRAMARFLKQHPEWSPLNWADEPTVPAILNRSLGLPLKAGLDTTRAALQAEFTDIIHELKRQARPAPLADTNRASVPVNQADTGHIDYLRDLYEEHTESLFAQALQEQGRQVSALGYWQQHELAITPDLWLNIVFAHYCSLRQHVRAAIAVEMQGDALPGFTGNQLISEIRLRRVR